MRIGDGGARGPNGQLCVTFGLAESSIGDFLRVLLLCEHFLGVGGCGLCGKGGLFDAAFGFGHLGLRACDLLCDVTAIDASDQLSSFYGVAFIDEELEEPSGDAGSDALFGDGRDIANDTDGGDDVSDFDRRRSYVWCALCLAWPFGRGSSLFLVDDIEAPCDGPANHDEGNKNRSGPLHPSSRHK